MTAAKNMDIVSRLPGCSGKAADAVSAYAQEKWEMLTNYSKFQNRSVQTFGFVYHDTTGEHHGPVWKTKSFLLSQICTVILWQDYCGKVIWENPIAARLERGFQLGMLIRTPWKRVNLICVCGWHKIGWKETKHWSYVESMNKEVYLGEPTSFLDHVYLGCSQRQCKISQNIVDKYRTMFESRISAGGVEKLPFPQNLRLSSWSYDMAGHAKKCVERYCELPNKKTQQLYKVSTPCIDDHHFKKKQSLLENCHKYALKLF